MATAKDKKATATAPAENAEGETKKKRTRTAMPFGRSFGVTVKFHNDMSADDREKVVSGILEVISGTADNETLDVHRSTRGEPNPNLQTWLIAPFGYDWPEGDNKERGVRIPSGPLADALRAYAAKNNVSVEEAAAKFAEAFLAGQSTPESDAS